MQMLAGLRSSEVASQLGVSKSTVIRWTNAGKIPHMRTFGRQRRFHPKVIALLVRRWSGGERNIDLLREDLFRLQDELGLQTQTEEPPAEAGHLAS